MYNFTKKSVIKLLYDMSRLALLSLLIALTTTGVMIASTVRSQNLKKIDVVITNNGTSLKNILSDLEKQTGFSFYFAEEIGNISHVFISDKKTSLFQVFKEISEKKNLRFKQSDWMIAITKSPPPQQQGRISGKVLDERGESLPGASIKVVETGQRVQTAVDGSYNLSIAAGTYTLEISYISYQTKRVTDVVVKPGQLTPLGIVLNATTNTLNQVVVTGSYKKESIAALYTRQKNETGISNGISAEQIAALPDKNVGETLKRISGVSTNDNRRVVVRGIAERYNLAMMDGATLPSTDVQVRDFEFDIVPSNLIDNVVVFKTATPDMSFGFGGGLIQINTLAIPDQNFNSFSLGGKYINGSTGKDFLGYGRGKYDYFGFDDGTRDHFPKDIMVFTTQNYIPKNPDAIPPKGITAITPAMIAAQNKRIGGLERMGTRTYRALPGQNYQFSLGRSYNIKSGRFGFVGSLSYRNEQSIEDISHFGRGDWEKLGNQTIDLQTGNEVNPTFANQYNFNTSLAALLNFG